MRLDTTQHEEKNCRNLAIVQSEPSMKEKTQAYGAQNLIQTGSHVFSESGRWSKSSQTTTAKTMRLRMCLIRETMSSPASLNFSSIYLRRAYSIPLKLTIQCVSFWKTAKFDYNGHVSIMAILCFSGEMTIWGTCDDGAQSSEVSVTWSGSLWRLSSKIGDGAHSFARYLPDQEKSKHKHHWYIIGSLRWKIALRPALSFTDW